MVKIVWRGLKERACALDSSLVSGQKMIGTPLQFANR
jgi:hypothetical protein